MVHAARPREPGVRFVVAAAAIVCAAAGFGVGFLVGRESAPSQPAAATTPTAAGEQPEGEAALASALLDSWLARLQLAAELRELQALAEAGGADLSRVVDEGIASLSDGELRSLLASTVRLTPDEIGDVSDLRAFSGRLAEIAMADILRPEEPGGNADRVAFGTSPSAAEWSPRSRFRPGSDRIYAVFPTDDFGDDTVMVKWYRRDRPEILLFQRYPVVAGDATGHVWMQPREGWSPGQYKVDVYTGDETLTRLASGWYWVGE